ncbi:Astacin-like metalloendopeptidase [Portunus trituberculatus]|uniref:Metalloendopeptidase n=1 Tax=Portunus trituberculatus TaxID=210409 RepID=A0A5B7KDW7_PORTR|nr:Astacin-like metalloendopeptidase [Portunus trituberculatus]
MHPSTPPGNDQGWGESGEREKSTGNSSLFPQFLQIFPQFPPPLPPPLPVFPEPLEVFRMAEVRRWPSPDIPVVISGLYTPENRRGIEEGLKIIENLTCVRFVNAGETEVGSETAHVLITPGVGGCNAVPGYNAAPGYVSVVHLHAPDCITRIGHVLHEIMHVLGFYHEHQRLDRDSHIEVHYDNILPGHEANFRRVFNETLGLPYDAGSVMHYGPKGFCADCSRPTITAREGVEGADRMGQRFNLSMMDVARVNRLYQCSGYYLGLDLLGSTSYVPPQPITEPIVTLPPSAC